MNASLQTNKKSTALLALILLVPVASIGVWFAMSYAPTRGTTIGQAIYGGAKVWLLLFPLAWLLFVERVQIELSSLDQLRIGKFQLRKKWGRISLSPARQGGLMTGAVLGLLILAAIIGIYLLVGDQIINKDEVRAAADRNGIGTIGRYLGLAVLITIFNALMEEYVWRWFVFRKCEVLLGGFPAVIASALLFTIHHIVALKAQMGWTPTLLACLGVFIGGCTWSWCYLKYRSVWPGYISHIFADIAVYFVGWHIIFGG